MAATSSGPEFDLVLQEPLEDVLLAGVSEFGLAGLTAVDYLVDRLSLEQIGHVKTRGLPTITPFENGQPRHPVRVFADREREFSVLVGELFVPLAIAERFADAVGAAVDDASEIVVLSGVPYPHGPDDHRTFYVATPDYRTDALAAASIPPMGQGFVDGVNASLLERGIDQPFSVGVLITPAHAQTPDVEAALRLVESVRSVYDIDVDTTPLQSFAQQVATHYQELSARIERADDADRPEDRMYM